MTNILLQCSGTYLSIQNYKFTVSKNLHIIYNITNNNINSFVANENNKNLFNVVTYPLLLILQVPLFVDHSAQE